MTRIALIFDVETSGLIRKGETLPHILQMSFILYDIEDHNIIMTYDTFVKPSQEVKVSEKITELTGITQKNINRGRPIRQALEDFFRIMGLCDIIVGHNMEFDKKMIALELTRVYPTLIKPTNGKEISFIHILNTFGENSLSKIWHLYVFNFVRDDVIDEFCTMHHSKVACNIIRTNSRGSYVKFPTLSETYEKLFCEIPENLHNSLMDTIVCLRCFMHLYKKEDIGIIST